MFTAPWGLPMSSFPSWWNVDLEFSAEDVGDQIVIKTLNGRFTFFLRRVDETHLKGTWGTGGEISLRKTSG